MNNYQEQLDALAALVEDWAVKKDPKVKGAFTSGDYVTYRLNEIFTPAGWSFTILNGPEVVTINEANAYVRLVGRLFVRFADGREAHQDDIGIWPLTATGARNGGTLETTAAERYETVEKAARTDCLKNAARNLGPCFAPQTDLELLAHIKRQAYLKVNGAGPTQSTTQNIADLFGEDKLPPKETSSTTAERKLHARSSSTPTRSRQRGEDELPPAPPKDASGETSSTTGLDRLLTEVNQALAENGLEQYASLDTLKTMLKNLGHRRYVPADHNTLRLQLISSREPNGKKKE